MKLETYEALPINQSPIRLLKRDYLARMDFDLVGFPSGTTVKFKALLPDGQEYEDDDSTHFRVLNNKLTYRVPRDLSESSGSLVSAFFSINGVESSRLLIHITEPNDIKSNNYIGQIDRIMNHVLSDAILINEISTDGSEILGAKTDELVNQVTQWTSDTLAKIDKTVGSISDVQKTIDQAIDVDRSNFQAKVDDISKSLDTAKSDMSELSSKIETAKKDISQIDNDTVNSIQTKLGNVPAGSTVMDEIGKSQVVTGATVNGNSVPIDNKNLQITLPNPDLSEYVKTSTLGLYAKTTDVDAKLSDAKTAKDTADSIQAKLGNVPTGSTVMDEIGKSQSDAKTAKDTADSIQAKLGNVPTGSTVMDEIGKSQGISDTGWVPVSLMNGWTGQANVRLKDGVVYHNGYLDPKSTTADVAFKYPDSFGDMTSLNTGGWRSAWTGYSRNEVMFGEVDGALKEFFCYSEHGKTGFVITLSHIVFKL